MDKILIVDDNEINRDILKDIFEEQYETMEAVDGEDAIEQLKKHASELSLVFLDLLMPKKTGLDVLAFMKLSDLIDRLPVIMITGESTIDSDVKAYEYGAADIIYKPFSPRVVMRRAMNIIELFKSRRNLEDQLDLKTRELRVSQAALLKNNEFLVNALGTVVEFRSCESGEHIHRVKGFTKILLRYLQENYPEYNLTNQQIDLIAAASVLHDVGKIAIPDAILNKPGKLTKAEFEEMKKHTIYGCEILKKFEQGETEFYKYCYEICRWHHEKYDGNGYPDRLVGEDIPIWAQVVSIVDCFDALVSKRVYKTPYSVDVSFDMINNGECGVFSDKVLDCFSLAKAQFFDLVENKYTFVTNTNN